MLKSMNKKTNESGFGVIGVLAVIIVLTALGGAGWYVWHKNQAEPTQNSTTQTQPQASTTQDQTTDPTKGWITYTSDSGKFSLKYPKNWTLNNCSGDVLLGATPTEAGHCQSGAVAQVQISSVAGDVRQSWQLKPGAVYPDLSTSTVSVNGTRAIKQTATSSLGSNNMAEGIPDGTKVTDYIFYLNGRTYLFAYNQEPSATDISVDASLIVTKTLTFN